MARERRAMVVTAYDPGWPRMYEEEGGLIQEAVGPVLVALQHVGSTAVPGLVAKPIIDIIGGVARLEDARRCLEPLKGLGYEYVPEYEKFLPERRYFRKGPPEARSHHLHVVEVESSFWNETLLFRDVLRSRPEVAQSYEELKRRLAREYAHDSWEYTEAKGPFIRSILAQAEAEGG